MEKERMQRIHYYHKQQQSLNRCLPHLSLDHKHCFK